MGMLSIDADGDLLDPRVRKKERFPVLRTDGEKGVFGPGHNSFVRAEDGTTDLCFYHARQYDEITGDPLYDPNRHTMVLALAYDNTGRYLRSRSDDPPPEEQRQSARLLQNRAKSCSLFAGQRFVPNWF